MLIGFVMETLGLLLWFVRMVVITQFVLYLLLVFNVVSMNNGFVSAAWRFTSTVLDPLLDPIRRRLPPLNGIDFSYMVLLFGLWALNTLLGVTYVAMSAWLLN